MSNAPVSISQDPDKQSHVKLDQDKAVKFNTDTSTSPDKISTDKISTDKISTELNTLQSVEWSPENEMIMVEWCDIAQCYKWLSSKAHQKFAQLNAWMTIPTIILSTISGTASFAQTSLPLKYQTFSPMIIGTINISIGILSTIQQYLKISELNEGHRVASIAWDKFARNICIELAKAPAERMDAGQFLKISRQEFDRLMETSPTIPNDVIKQFNVTFAGKDGSAQRKRYDDLKKPDICDIIISANEKRHPWYLQPKPEIAPSTSALRLANLSLSEKNDNLKDRESIIMQKERDIQEKLDKRAEVQLTFQKNVKNYSAKIAGENKKIDDYIANFYNVYGRKPLSEEIVDHFDDIIEQDIIDNYLKKYTTVVAVIDADNMV